MAVLFRLGWSCPDSVSTPSSSARSFARSAMDDLSFGDLGVDVSSVNSVEDLHRCSGPKRAKRTIRHRAQKRYRPQKPNSDDFPPLNDSTNELVESIESIVTTTLPLETPSYADVLMTPVILVEQPTPHPPPTVVTMSHVARAIKPRQKHSPVPIIPAIPNKRNVIPILDLRRDRRRRVACVKRTSVTPATRRDLAKSLAKKYTGVKNECLAPLWARYAMAWTKPSLEEVKQAADVTQHTNPPNVIPIYQEISADLLTPVSAYLKISNGAASPHSFLLESVAGGEKIGRYSFLGVDPYKVIRTGDASTVKGDPLITLEKELNGIRYYKTPGLPEFTGGAVGYIAYDCVRYFEPRTSKIELRNTLNLPDAVFMMFDTVVIFDHLHHLIKVVSHLKLGPTYGERDLDAEYARATGEIHKLIDKLESDALSFPVQPPIVSGEAVSNIGKAGYEEFVNKLKYHIVEGDIIQCVPSQRVKKPTTLHPFNAYRRLRSVNPSPYMFYVDCRDFQLVGASPELLVSVDTARKVTNHPIAGTVRRGKTPAEDDALATQLLSDVKERAEHIQLVDLGRNDINRVCDPKTVKVESLMHIERFSHVMHIVSHVTGTLREEKTPFDAFRSVFPAGTVSGAPKVRAMELIYELERDHRGTYAGAVGHFDYAGGFDTCIAIRTMLFKDGVAYLQAGGGIVYDSDPEAEYNETLHKLNSNVMSLASAEAFYSIPSNNKTRVVSVLENKSTSPMLPFSTNGTPIKKNRMNGPSNTSITTTVTTYTTTMSNNSAPHSRSSTASNSPQTSISQPQQPHQPAVTILIDNYDSFTWNVYQRLCELGANVVVFRNDQVTVEECMALNPRNIVISPGPGKPRDAGVSNDVIRAFAGRVPILGVCLGEQCMYEIYGGEVTRAGETVHGKTSAVTHDGKGLYDLVPQHIECTRYHSLAGNPRTLPDCLIVTAYTDSGIIMGVRHKTFVMEGVQFHPESIASEYGRTIFRNFLRWEGPTWDQLVLRDDLVPDTVAEDGSDVGSGRGATGGGIRGPPTANRVGGGLQIGGGIKINSVSPASSPSRSVLALPNANGSSAPESVAGSSSGYSTPIHPAAITAAARMMTNRDINREIKATSVPSFSNSPVLPPSPIVSPSAVKKDSILETIAKRRTLDSAQDKAIPGKSLAHVSRSIALGLAPPCLDFYQRILQASHPPSIVAVMAEIKRASPSKGDIDSTAHAAQQALLYARAGASVISVLTEPTWFKGSIEDLRQARIAVNNLADRPAILRKEFVVDEYQIYEARLAGADTVLLIVAILSDQQLAALMSASRMLGMEPLVEVANTEEMARAIRAGSKVIGVNNRDLHTFNVDPTRTSTLASMVPSNVILVALSGISSRQDVEPYIRSGARAVLVGEALMRSGSPGDLIQSLRGVTPTSTSRRLVRHAKICGLTRAADALVAARNGASFLGIIFAPSPRQVTPDQALDLVRQVSTELRWSQLPSQPHLLSTLPIPGTTTNINQGLEVGYRVLTSSPRPLFVGVFQDQPLSYIHATVTKVGLDVVQLHGDEPDSIIALIPAPVIRVVHVQPSDSVVAIEDRVNSAVRAGAAAVLLDTASATSKGGTGQVFDWSVAAHLASKGMYIMLAGGLTSENVGQVAVLGPYVWCADASSGVEGVNKGVKDPNKIISFLKAIS
ncbi:hypothetical protein SmJEL517_g01143 [Synchytrium microbalum]|uniref:Multifunctional tryptophan biosynthesis protein n=1 Tax=Synchytrium microbalum TaxID=1806994 RepID=A0A507C6S6_9FUNG|nr:uncharacterized protein SmJEL517_g01143 [Synchytrium microbalum]TPX36747.1 hypothetical protein SmJEL517_g01143 [Synchytrium microbalum]